MTPVTSLKAVAPPDLPVIEKPWLARMASALQVLPAAFVTLIILASSLFIGWMDYASGWELSLFILYAVPIMIAVWRLGSRAGLLTAAWCSVVWLVANEASHPYETQLGYIWAMFSRLFYFSVVVFAVLAVRNKQAADAARIQMLEEQRQLEADIVSVSEHEQQRIGQDLHDGLCQQLAAIGCAARALADELQEHDLPEARDAILIEDSIQQAVLEARNLARGIFPVHVDRSGLAAALIDLGKTMSRLTGASIKVRNCLDVPVDSPEVSMHLYRIAQEAVANAVRHSGASEITIALEEADDSLELRVEDNGKGMTSDSHTRGDGMGLRTMRYRAQALGATLETGNIPGGGTFVRCRLQNPHSAA
jgi:signal transduction histidine kinase